MRIQVPDLQEEIHELFEERKQIINQVKSSTFTISLTFEGLFKKLILELIQK